MQSFPQPLSVEEENEYIERWEQGDRDARNILIERNLRLVAYLVKKYSNSDHSVDDLISIGTIGLIKAVDTYRLGKGVRLATYASRCIDNAIQCFGWIGGKRNSPDSLLKTIFMETCFVVNKSCL